MQLGQASDPFRSAWRERLKALRNIPPSLKIVWEAGPRVVASGIVCRIVAARLLIDSLRDYAICLLDIEGRILTWSAAAEQINGYRTEEIVGKDFADLYRRADIRQGKPQKLLEKAAAKGRVEGEEWRLHKDGSRFWARVVITALRDQQGRLCGFGKVVSDATSRKRSEGTLRNLTERLDQRVQERTSQLTDANGELRESLAQLRALAAHLQSVREDERTSSAREIHDELGQAFGVNR